MISNFDIDLFLKDYWQQKPLLIKSAFPGYQCPVDANELAGLACEEEVESRIISELKQPSYWKLENGPFPESRFSTLPESHWTLLVQGVDKLIPEFKQLLNDFSFIPSWRLDDIMVSYAPVSGSVGPHIDQYDVFLLQAQGQRNWKINTHSYSKDDFIKDIPINVLNNFTAESEWTLSPGDMLYLPPGVAHYGIALDDCITISVGFRSPSHAELLTSFIDDLVPTLDESLRFQDPNLNLTENPGEISNEALNNIKTILSGYLSDDIALKKWFGRFITEYMHDAEHDDRQENNADITRLLTDHARIIRDPYMRINYIEDMDTFLLFINGELVTTEDNPQVHYLARSISNSHELVTDDIKDYLNETSLQFLQYLYDEGYIYID